jgi:hypothetical protein
MAKSITADSNRKQRRRDSSAVRHGAAPAARVPTGTYESPVGLARLLPWLAVALALALYSGVLSYPFVYDDIMLLNDSGLSWENLPQYFLHSIWSQPGKEMVVNYYRPFSQVWMMLNHEAFGQDPAGYHAGAVALYGLTTLLVYLLALRTLKNRVSAGFAALLFAAHPLHVEPVTWISGVTETEFAAFFLLSMLCYLRWSESENLPGCRLWVPGSRSSDGPTTGRRSRAAGTTDSRQLATANLKWYLLSLACYGFSLLSKETAVVLCALIFFYEWKRQGASGPPQLLPAGPQGASGGPGSAAAPAAGRLRRIGRAAGVTVPYVALTAVYTAVRIVALKGLVPAANNDASRVTLLCSYSAVMWFYLRKMLWPLPMSLFYPLDFVTYPGLKTVVWPLLASLALLAGLWVWSRRCPPAGIASAWLMLPVAPAVLAIASFPPADLVHDRYLFLPSVGLAMLLALALQYLGRSGTRFAGVPVVQMGAVAVLLCVSSGITLRQEKHWSSEPKLYGHAIEVAPQNPYALNWLSTVVRGQQGDNQVALGYAERALAAKPDYFEALINIGRLRWALHDSDAALPPLLRARLLHPERHEVHFWLGVVFLDKNRYREAEASFREALRLDPTGVDQHLGLGMAFQDEGRLDEARQEYQAELQYHPGSELAAKRLAALPPPPEGGQPSSSATGQPP